MTPAPPTRTVAGPYFEDLTVGQAFDTAPAVTLTGGLQAAHQAIVGCRSRLTLSAPWAQAVTGRTSLADPALVWNVAIGQSTLVTQNVRANLFYRGLRLLRLPSIGDTIATTTTVTELKQNRVRPGRPATGLAVLHMVTADDAGRPVLDFHRCAMLPLRDPDFVSSHSAPLATAPADLDDDLLAEAVADWQLPGTAPVDLTAGDCLEVTGGDVVSSAPELARLTLNIAIVHHDAGAAGGRRLVYGGHTIALALSQVLRAIPDLVTVLGWHGCDHLAPVYEGDLLTSEVEVERVQQAPVGRILHLRTLVSAHRDDGAGEVQTSQVLDWRFAALVP